jgi:hypothetical protein
MTEEEEQTQVVRNGIRAATGPPPPHDLSLLLSELRRFAYDSDRAGVLDVLKKLVPTFRSTSFPVASSSIRHEGDIDGFSN